MITFTQSIQVCFRKYATFHGRATRAEFWWFLLFCVLVSIAVDFIDCGGFGRCGDGATWHEGLSNAGVLGVLWSLATVLPSLAVGARRLHDIGYSGWWQLLSLTIIGIIPLLVMFCIPTRAQGKKYEAAA